MVAMVAMVAMVDKADGAAVPPSGPPHAPHHAPPPARSPEPPPEPHIVRPWLTAALVGFVAGDVVLQQSSVLPASAIVLALGLAGATAGLGAVWAGRQGQARCAALLAVLCAHCAGYDYAGARARLRMDETLAAADEGRDVRVQGVVASLPASFEGGVRFALDVESVADPAIRVPPRIALSWYAPEREVLPAQRWALTVRLRRPHGSLNPGGFDAEAWMLEQDIRAQGTVRAGRLDALPRLVDECVLRFNPLVDRARARLRTALQEALRERRYGNVIVALVMGDQGPISEQDWALFNRTGISHLVSISGLHITMIAGAVALLAAALWRRSPLLLRLAGLPLVRAVAAIGGGFSYCLLAGWGVPAQRTLLMLGTFALAQCGRTRLAPGLVLAAAATLVCLLDPWAVLAAGFWLSFGAVACIFFALSGRLDAGGGWRGRLREGLRVQGAITIGQMPLTLAIFGQVSVVAPLANAVAIPLVSYLVAPLALIGAGLLACGSGTALAGIPLLDAAEFLFRMLAVLLQALSQPAWSWFSLPAPPWWVYACAGLACAMLLAPPGWPLRWVGVCWLLPLFCWPLDRPAHDELRVCALDVGQGMSLVLETAEHVVVFDTGPRYGADSDAGGRVLVPYLRGRGIRQIDLLVVSHPDIDHAGGASSLLHAMPVQRLLTSIEPGHRLLDGAGAVERCVAGQHIELGALALDVLGPPAELYAQPRASTNARSCVVLARLGGRSVLLTGDVPARQERQMVAAVPLAGLAPLDLLVAPHHGSRSSSSPALLDATRPRWASMQLGYRNHFGHPHDDVLQRYRARSIEVVRSDESGAAQWRLWAGGATRLERWRVDHPHYWNDQPAGGPTTATQAPTMARRPTGKDPA